MKGKSSDNFGKFGMAIQKEESMNSKGRRSMVASQSAFAQFPVCDCPQASTAGLPDPMRAGTGASSERSRLESQARYHHFRCPRCG